MITIINNTVYVNFDDDADDEDHDNDYAADDDGDITEAVDILQRHNAVIFSTYII